MIEVNRIYFDLDGVLADFGKGVRILCDMDPSDQFSHDKEHDDRMFDAIRKVDHFYLKLEPFDDAVSVFRELRVMYGDKVEILSAIPKPERNVLFAEDDKREWVAKYIDKDVKVNIVLRKEKREYAKDAGCILVDDTVKNITEWTEAGGTGISFTDADSLRRELFRLQILNE